MEQKKVKASVIVRAYNSEDTIERTLESALSQDFHLGDYEVICVNDGSSDGTQMLIDAYTQKDLRVRAVHQENEGPVKAANRGFEMSRGEYVTLLDGDDEFLPYFLSQTVAILEADPSLDFSYSDYLEEVDGIRKEVPVRHMLETIAGGVVFRKRSIEAAGFYEESMKFAEYDLLLRTWDAWRKAHVEAALYVYHRRHTSISAQATWVEQARNELLKKYPERADDIASMRRYQI